MKLSIILKDRNNGLTQSRVILALLVLLDHQFTLFQVPRPALLSGALTPSAFAVYMFIFMSGLLCYISRTRNSAPRFMVLRLARIFPGYAACLALSSVVFIPLLACFGMQGGSNAIQQVPKILRASADYFFGNIAFTQNVYLPPSLQIENPVPAINGSLWTLQPEIMGYLLIAVLFPLFALIPRLFVIILFLGATSLALLSNSTRVFLQALLGGYGFETATDSHLYLALYLLSGILFAVYASKIDVNVRLAVISAGLLIIAYFINIRLFNILSPFALPYVFLAACWFIRWPWGSGADWSYGVYLYSFPLQQITWNLQERHVIGTSFGMGLVLVCLASMAFGAASYYLVEHPVRLRILSLLSPAR